MTTMPQPRAFSRGLDPIWPACIVVVAVLFNPVLAFINGNIRELTSGPVIAAEMLVMAAAQVWVLQRFDRRMQPWYALMALIGAFTVLRALVTGTFEARYFRDILVLQTFVVLGMTSTERRAIETMLVLQAVVVAGIALEAVSLDTFNALFHVKDYYINTRGLLSVEFTDESSSLYVSATRPEARYFPFFDLHRLSSIFLEPVSLGNFCIITVSFTAAFWQRFGGRRKVFLVAAIVLMLFACDGRQSAMASVLIVAMLAVARVLPANVALLFLPLAVAAAVGVTALLGLRSGQDDLPGRIAVMVELLADMQLADWLGASDRLRIIAVDSGIVYLLITQSVLCVAILWGLVVTGMEERTRTHQTYKNGMFLYIAISMIVSYGFISIKTAAPMWFIYGMLAASGWARQVAADDRRPAALGLGRPTAGE